MILHNYTVFSILNKGMIDKANFFVIYKNLVPSTLYLIFTFIQDLMMYWNNSWLQIDFDIDLAMTHFALAPPRNFFKLKIMFFLVRKLGIKNIDGDK